MVERLLDAGAIVGGKANLHELGLGNTGNNPTTGAIRNPYDPALIGSDGTAAAVAARLMPAGLGTDTGGGARIAAALCGCVGFRPTLGRYDPRGFIPISHTRDTPAPIARTVDDVILLDGVCAATPAAPTGVDLRGARIGVPRGHFYDNLDSGLAAVVEAALLLLAGAGAELVEVDLPDVRALNDAAGLPIVLFEVARELAANLYGHGSRLSVLDIVERMAGPVEKFALQTQMTRALMVPAAAYAEALTVHRPRLVAAYADYFQANDLAAFVVPTTPLPARPIGDDETVELNGSRVPTLQTYNRNTDASSNAGMPCLSVPAGLTAGGLPVGIEFVGPSGSDARLLGLGRAFESIRAPLAEPAAGRG